VYISRTQPNEHRVFPERDWKIPKEGYIPTSPHPKVKHQFQKSKPFTTSHCQLTVSYSPPLPLLDTPLGEPKFAHL
jgi:hypothetical protein